jgi:hypothetical protein
LAKVWGFFSAMTKGLLSRRASVAEQSARGFYLVVSMVCINGLYQGIALLIAEKPTFERDREGHEFHS